MVFLVLLAAAVLTAVLALIIFRICQYREEKEMEKYYEAARQMVKEECLNYSLKNPYLKSSGLPERNPLKIMLYIKLVKAKEKGRFVFDPKEPVIFGRQKESVSVLINEGVVSARHCKVYLVDNQAALEDMGSVNGTGLIRRRRQYTLTPGYPVILEQNDIIHVGSRYFQVKLFYYDTTAM